MSDVTDRLDALEKVLQGGVGQYNVQQLQRALETSWQPDGDTFLLPNSYKDAPFSVGTTLPTSPRNGQPFWYNGVVGGGSWLFVWGGGTWNFVGGSPAAADNDLAYAMLVGGYVATTGGPSVTVPFAGAYDISHGANLTDGGSGTAEVSKITVKLGGAAANDLEAIVYAHPGSAASQSDSPTRTVRRPLAAGDTIAQYASSVNGVDTATRRWLRVTPVTVN